MLAEAASLAQLAHQEVLVGNASVLQGIDAGTIPPQGVGDKQMMECCSQGSMGGDGVSMLQRVVKTDDPSSQGVEISKWRNVTPNTWLGKVILVGVIRH